MVGQVIEREASSRTYLQSCKHRHITNQQIRRKFGQASEADHHPQNKSKTYRIYGDEGGEEDQVLDVFFLVIVCIEKIISRINLI